MSGFACATPVPPAKANEKIVPHIALLLPLKSPAFKSAAEAIQQGFQAAADMEMELSGKLPVQVYGCSDEEKEIVALYRGAIAAGARAVVGPLTRSGISILAKEQDIPVPTLTLNILEEIQAGQLYFFGLAAEAEAKQVAQLAKQQGFRKAIVIATRAQLSKRLQFAFENEWNESGGTLLNEIEFNGDLSVFKTVTNMVDTAVFLAVNAEKARLIRPYLPNKLPIYATSQIFLGNNDTLNNYDLNNIRFVDMPWLLQADHPAVMIYPRSARPLSADHERLYALGVDAFRLIQLLMAGRIDDALPLDGVSGYIKLNGRTFQRTAIPAVFSQGGALVAPVLQMLPPQSVEKP